MAQITKNMLINEVLEANSNASEILMSAGMHCLGCAAAHGESLEEACEVHGIDVNELVNELNK